MADRVKDRVRDHFEHKIDRLHRFADIVTFPLAPIDGAIHGVARGVLNWLVDVHPEDRHKPEYAHPPQYGYPVAGPPPQYGYPVAGPPPPQPYGYPYRPY